MSPVRSVLLGAVLGVGLSCLWPRPYRAEATLYFPSINGAMFKKYAELLKGQPGNTEWKSALDVSGDQAVEVASHILTSRAATVRALQDASLSLDVVRFGWNGDPVDNFRLANLRTEVLSGSSLRLDVKFSRPEAVRTLCQGLLNYYTSFVHDHRLTNTARSREQLEKKVARIERRLAVLEGKLTFSRPDPLHSMADVVVRPDIKTLRELWKKRILEQGSSQRVLEEVRRARKDTREPAEDPQDDEAWLKRWGSTVSNGGNLPNNVRRSELTSRLELERVYEETLLLYHSALLQHDFLATWESLENFDFELLDPVSVSRESLISRSVKGALAGACLGLLAFFLLGSPFRRRDKGFRGFEGRRDHA